MRGSAIPPPREQLLDGHTHTESALKQSLLQAELRELTIESLPDPAMAEDIRGSLAAGITAGAVFESAGEPDGLFREAVARALRSVSADDPSGLLPRFLSLGPYERDGPIPPELQAERLSDDDVFAAIELIFSACINSFQGALGEMLAITPLLEIAAQHHRLGGDECRSVLYVGDAVLAGKPADGAWAKAADFHLLRGCVDPGEPGVQVVGVAEVKSFSTSPEALDQQLDGHIARARAGLRLGGVEIKAARVAVGQGADSPLRISVAPDTWPLSRGVRFVELEGGGRYLAPPETVPPHTNSRSREIHARRWHVTLRWSDEALAAAAYEMTFWYLGILGKLAFADRIDPTWKGMTLADAGQNAAKMMLYYAISRARSPDETSKAIALYNSYGFGYALGSNFVDRRGRRQMLWPSDLDEIAATGRSRAATAATPLDVCRIRNRRPRRPAAG